MVVYVVLYTVACGDSCEVIDEIFLTEDLAKSYLDKQLDKHVLFIKPYRVTGNA